ERSEGSRQGWMQEILRGAENDRGAGPKASNPFLPIQPGLDDLGQADVAEQREAQDRPVERRQRVNAEPRAKRRVGKPNAEDENDPFDLIHQPRTWLGNLLFVHVVGGNGHLRKVVKQIVSEDLE